jgi:class 3 adenylate cyclase/tetratricopeptide (TPR) repeat protein
VAAPPRATQPNGETAAERRLVSVLFADLVSFVSYAEGRDHEDVRDTLNRYFGAAREVIERHGGQVEKFIGDAIMAEWGAPRTNEDDAERAVRAALEVIEAVRDLGEDLHVRVAVLTGQAAVTLGATDQGMVAGDLVNTAARLQSVAPPDTVLVGDATMQAASRAVAFEEAGEQVLKGKEAPVRAWRALRVIGDSRGRGRGEGLEPPFVGRDLELRLLKDLINTAGVERRPRLVSITGPAGIGKSRLAWEFEKYVDGLVETIYWHRGRSPSYGEGIAFWALGEMIRRRARLVESDDESTTRERIKQVVQEFVEPAESEWVEGALLTLLGLEPPPPGGRDALFAAWRTFFERLAQRHPTILIFEDLHWADDGQIDFIDHVLEWTRDVPLLVITLARSELLERRPGWGTSARSFNAIGLEPLTDASMRELLTGLVPRMPESTVERIRIRADGIPLYAVETVRSLISDGRLTPNEDGTFAPVGDLGELAIPDTLRALVASRLDGLEADDRALVQDATVLGQTFDHRALAHVIGAEADDVEARLRVLVKRELLEIAVDPGAPERGQFGFVQSTLRDVAYETLSRRDRRERHLAAARYYEKAGDEEIAAVLARHYLAALESSEPGPEADALRVQARVSLRAAADRAMDLGSPDQALSHLDTALAITTAPGERAPLLGRAATAATATAATALAIDYARAAVAAYDEAGDRRSCLGAAGVLAGTLLDAGQLDEAVELLEHSADEAEPYPEVLADLLARTARAYMRLTRDDEAVAAADRAIGIAEPLMLDRILAEAFVNKGSAKWKLGRLREPRLLMTEAAELAHKAGDFDLELRARANLSVSLAMHDLPAAQALRLEAVELAKRMGNYKFAGWLQAHYNSACIEAGLDWDSSASALEKLWSEVVEPVGRADVLEALLWHRVLRGQEHRELVEEMQQLGVSQDDPETIAFLNLLRGYPPLFGGRPEETLRLTREAVPSLGQGKIMGYWMMLMAGLQMRDVDVVREAEGLIRETTEITNANVGTQHAAAGALAALEGRDHDALEGFVRAVEHFAAAGWLYNKAVIQAMALAALPEETAIEGWAEEARDRFEILGASPDLGLLERALATRAPRPSGSDYADGHGVDMPVAARQRGTVDSVSDTPGSGDAAA